MDIIDLTFGSHPHIRAKHSDAGCDDTVHPIFLFVSICVLPQQLYGQISRKHLSVMGMTAKLCIHSGISQFLQLSRLMLQYG